MMKRSLIGFSFGLLVGWFVVVPVIGWSIDFIKSDGPALVWALVVPCYIKHTCSEGEK